jgi:hypothetical protein
MKTSIKAKHLTGIKDAEFALARQETGEVLADLPPGHPLLVAAESERQQGADIADLPESHPLKVALREAKDRELTKQQEAVKEAERLKVRKAKRLEESKEHRAQVDAEEQEREAKRDTYKVINEKINRAIDGVDGLLTVINATAQETFGEDRFSVVKVARLQRLMFAARRGLLDSRLRG